MIPERRILQIIPAEGWLAVYELGTGDVSDLRTKGLVCWALVEEMSETSVVGMDADQAAGVKEAGKFVGYARVGEGLARFRK